MIPLTGKLGAGLSVKVSSSEVRDRVLAYAKHWYLDTNGYAWCIKEIDGEVRGIFMHQVVLNMERHECCVKVNGEHFFMHRFLSGEKYVDHINKDRLDNRRCNLFVRGAWCLLG